MRRATRATTWYPSALAVAFGQGSMRYSWVRTANAGDSVVVPRATRCRGDRLGRCALPQDWRATRHRRAGEIVTLGEKVRLNFPSTAMGQRWLPTRKQRAQGPAVPKLQIALRKAPA